MLMILSCWHAAWKVLGHRAALPLPGGHAMLNTEIEIQRLASAMIERHGATAAKAAVGRLNQMIDRGDRDGMERWPCVVSLIHRSQAAAPAVEHRGQGVAA